MQALDHDEARWRSLERQPAALAHPRRLAGLFDGLVGDDVAAKLLAEERFHDRLSALLGERHGLSRDRLPRPECTAGLRLALASAQQVESWVALFGAVWWSRAIVGVIEARAVVALQQALGEEAYAAAIAHRDLAGPETVLPPAETFAARTIADGLHCLAAWCSRQPHDLAARIRLRLPESEALDGAVIAPFDLIGPRIVERVVTSEAA